MDKSLVLNDRLDALEYDDTVTHRSVASFLAALPPEDTVEYSVSIAKLVGCIDGVTGTLESILEDDDLQEVESTDGTTIRFAAFRALSTYHRRNKNITALETLHEEYGSLFSDRPMYDQAYSVLLRMRGDSDSIFRAIDTQERLLDTIDDNPAIRQAYANTITQAVEDGIVDEADRDAYLQKASTAIDEAISLWREYGKYHVTKGRILALEGKYGEGRRSIEKGIDLEDPERSDYAIRIGQFQQHLLRADFREYERRLQTRIDDANSKLSDIESESDEIARQLRSTMLQFLGFFTAIIAAIVMTIQISVNYPPQAAGQLIVIIFGGLTASFGGLSLILPDEYQQLRGRYVAALGMLFIGVGLVPLYLV